MWEFRSCTYSNDQLAITVRSLNGEKRTVQFTPENSKRILGNLEAEALVQIKIGEEIQKIELDKIKRIDEIRKKKAAEKAKAKLDAEEKANAEAEAKAKAEAEARDEAADEQVDAARAKAEADIKAEEG